MYSGNYTRAKFRWINGVLIAAVVLVSVLKTIAQDVVPEAQPEKQPETVGAKPATVTPAETRKPMKVVFDETSPGIVIVESNGEKLRIDTVNKTVKSVDAADGGILKPDATGTDKQPDTTTAAAPDDKKDPTRYDFDKGREPFDYRLVNIPTAKHVPKGTWNLVFTHRFSQQLRPLSESARGLFGLDSFGIAAFGMTYGITDKLYATAYRSPLCRRGVCRTIEIGLGYNWIAQDTKSPIAVTTYASIEGNDNFTEEYTYNLQAMISGRVGKRLFLFFSPAIHLNSNGQRRFNPRPNDYFPPALIANDFKLPAHGASFGFGASVMITPNVMAMFDFTPRTGFKMGQIRTVLGPNFAITGFRNESHPTIGFGIQRNVHNHSFALTFSNTQATTTSRYNSSSLVLSPKKLIIGFNLSRRF